MQFKEGDKVQLKKLTEKERQTIPLFYNENMLKHEGKTGTILELDTNFQGYIIYYIQFTDTQKWWWLEDWIEPKTEYEAF